MNPVSPSGSWTSSGSIGFPLSRLTLEVTETAIMADPVRAKTVLTELHDAGILSRWTTSALASRPFPI